MTSSYRLDEPFIKVMLKRGVEMSGGSTFLLQETSLLLNIKTQLTATFSVDYHNVDVTIVGKMKLPSEILASIILI